jgi:hypothetical protein
LRGKKVLRACQPGNKAVPGGSEKKGNEKMLSNPGDP